MSRNSINLRVNSRFFQPVLYYWHMQMVFVQPLMLTLLMCLSSGVGKSKVYVACLPAGIQLEEVISGPQPKSTTTTAVKLVTVRDTLVRLKARCKKGKLVAGNGREIRFYRLIGCWGNPPDNYQEQLAQQTREIQRLKKKYTVVEIPCGELDPRQIY